MGAEHSSSPLTTELMHVLTGNPFIMRGIWGQTGRSLVFSRKHGKRPVCPRVSPGFRSRPRVSVPGFLTDHIWNLGELLQSA
jgi:hypothetical protein